MSDHLPARFLKQFLYIKISENPIIVKAERRRQGRKTGRKQKTFCLIGEKCGILDVSR